MAIPRLGISSKALANHPNRIFLKHGVPIHHLLYYDDSVAVDKHKSLIYIYPSKCLSNLEINLKV